jgi:hypothetical protein
MKRMREEELQQEVLLSEINFESFGGTNRLRL